MPTTTTGLATSFITFSRPGASGGGATVTDRDGKIKWAGHNLLTHSERAALWTKTQTTGTGTDGIRETTNAGVEHFISQDVTLPAAKHTLIFYAKGVGRTRISYGASDTGYSNGIYGTFDFAAPQVAVAATAYGSGYTAVTSSIEAASDGFFKCTVVFSCPSGTVRVRLLSDNGSGTAASATTFAGDVTKGFDATRLHLYRSDMQMQLNPAQPAGMQSYYPTTPRNLLGYTEDFSNWTQTAATVTADSAIAPNGLQTADKIVATATSGYHARYRTTALGSAKYTISVYAKAAEYSLLHIGEGNFGSFCAAFDLASGTVVAGSTGGSTYVSSAIANAGNGWWRCSIVISNPAVTVATNIIGYPAGATINLYGAQYTGDGTSGIYLWGAQLSDSASLDTYVPVYGAAVTSAAYYAPRLDFDPVTLAAKGLLVEEARTNSLLNSRAITTSWESDGNATWVADATTSPSGVSDAGQLQYGTNGYRYQVLTLTAETYTASIYVKQGTGGNGLVRLEYDTLTADFNMTTGASSNVGAGVTVHPSVNAGNGWWRFAMTFTGLASSKLFLFRMLGTLTSGQGHYFYGAQIEKGSFPTSLIISPAGATATRAAEVASVSTQAFPYSASEGTLVVAHDFLDGTSSTTAAYYPGSIGDGQATPYMVMGLYGNGVPFTQVPTTALGTALGFTNSVSKIGLAFTGSSQSGSKDGSAASSSSMTATLSAAGLLRISGPMYGLLNYSGYIRQITYIPRRLTAAELQSRTA